MPSKNEPHSTPQARFNRWKLGWGRTWAHRLFMGHHTQLNSLYWSHAPAQRFVFAATRGKSPQDPATALFRLPAKDQTRINIPLGDWATRYGDFDNWVRLNCLVGITGYLEVYLKTVTRLALESDPCVRVSVPHGLDGVAALKRRHNYSFAEEVEPCVIGTWSQRVAHYSRLFGKAPPLLFSSIRDLDRLRVIRNGVTHSFGRAADDYDSLLDMKPKPYKKVSEELLKAILDLVDKIALSVDEHLGPDHIGDYEALYFYHRWDKAFGEGHSSEAKALSRHMGQHHGRTQNIRYFEELISHYKAL